MSKDTAVRTWDLQAHHLQYFHDDQDGPLDVTVVMKEMRKWIKENDVDVESVNVRYHVNGMDEPTTVCGTVEYVV
jgi:hypothetical protein